MRKPLIAGNAKMNLNRADLTALIRGVLEGYRGGAEVVFCPPFTLLPVARDLLAATEVGLGAQNMHWESHGAYTGEVAGAMLREAGCTYVILGHSERRQYFGETDEAVSRKAQAALAAGLTPIVCVGESLEQREGGKTESLLRGQVEGGLSGLPEGPFVLAYEPVWAIGTGKTASPEQAQEAHAFLRGVLGEVLSPDRAQRVRILYGGSVKGSNASDLMALPDVDGALVGGASLTADAFLPILAGTPD